LLYRILGAADLLILAVMMIFAEFRHVVGKKYSKLKYENPSFPM